MNSDPDQLDALLKDVLPATADHCGPSGAEVLNMVRAQRQRCRRVQAGAAMLALAALAVVSLHWHGERQVAAPIAHAPEKPPAIKVRHVNDEQFFALLKDIPSAVLEGPDGQRTLLILQR